MSIDTTFKPIGQTVLVGVAAVAAVDKGAQAGVTTFRIRNTNVAANYITWGPTAAVTAAGAPVAGTPSVNTIGVPIGGVVYLEVPAASFFIATLASFEVTPGTGGIGG